MLRKIAGHRTSGSEPIAQLRERWSAEFPQLEDHAWPERLTRAGVATIACADAGWAQELSAESESLVARIIRGSEGPDVRQLRFVVGDRTARTQLAKAPASQKLTRISSSAAAAARLASSEVGDPALRVRLERLVALALSLRDQRQDAGDVGPD